MNEMREKMFVFFLMHDNLMLFLGNMKTFLIRKWTSQNVQKHNKSGRINKIKIPNTESFIISFFFFLHVFILPFQFLGCKNRLPKNT